MSDMTIDQLQAENDSLTAELEKVKAKNAELLGKLKKAQQGSGESSERLEALEAENEGLKTELRKFTFDAPVNSIFESISGAGKIFRKAFEEHFDIIQDEEEGRFWIHEKDGSPTLKQVKVGKYGNDTQPRELSDGEIKDLILERELKELDYFIPKPVGSGAPGSNGRGHYYVKPEPESLRKEEKPQQFGIR
ncbi:hypothetical protein [Billgrantia ethanolica]|uniref:Uncharacterized protein n=1 Tax=Billgrantia ethanolica TaxID=2733486 RepID=A0ABS9A2F4_9GAMM|nr:hypothetical protein [Halomonas ethanolica]MCE8002722.1 hypothetical protein [Halomonas ethanolica]